MNDIYNMMLQEHDISSSDSLRNATYEVMQQVVLVCIVEVSSRKRPSMVAPVCEFFINLADILKTWISLC